MTPAVYRLTYTLHEPMFFASRELGAQYITEPVLGSYSQPFALGWVRAPYRLEGDAVTRPAYRAHLSPLNAAGWYVTPARPVGAPVMRAERFNALGEGYRSRMGQGVVIDDMEGLLGDKTDRAVNRPQQGSIRFLTRGNQMVSWAISTGEAPAFPAWVRLGKTLAKAALSVATVAVVGQGQGRFQARALLNPVDLPPEVRPIRFDLIGVRPVPLLRDALLDGPHLSTADGPLPVGMAWRFPGEAGGA